MLKGGDTELVEAALGGDGEAFEMLVARYERALFNAAYRLSGNQEDAMDATQAAFVKAYENLARFDPSHRFFSWIYRIALNEALDIVNDRRRAQSLNSEPYAEGRSPEEACGAGETEKCLQEALMDLKPELRTVVVLRHFQGLSYRQMGEVVGIPEKTVKSRLFTARRKLRALLLERGVVG